MVNKRALTQSIVMLSVIMGSTIAPIAPITSLTASANFEDALLKCVNDSQKSLTGDGASGKSNGSIAADRIDDMKKIAQHMNQEYGFGQNQLAVIMSVAFRESGWRLNAVNPSGGVSGLFQWGTNSINGDRIRPAGVSEDKVLNMDLDSTIKVLDYEIKGGHVAQATKMNSLMVEAGNDPQKAFNAWRAFEGLQPDDSQNDTSGVLGRVSEIASELGTDNMKIDQSKIDSLPKLAGGANNAASSGTTTSSSSGDSCGSDSSSSPDGSGSITSSGKWKRGEEPSDVKSYIHDPEKAGLGWNKSDGWLNGISSGDQCTDFAESYFNLIWGLNMSSGVQGNGQDVADAEAKANGGSTSSTPHEGAIGSIPGGQGGTVANVGHVYVVEHVLGNGDIIVAEQNVAGVSGELAGMTHSWNYRVITKSDYTQQGHKFYTPDGKTLKWEK